MDAHTSSKRLLFIILVLALCNVLLGFHMKFGDSLVSLIELQNNVRQGGQDIPLELLKAINSLNQVVGTSELVSSYSLTFLLVLSCSILLIAFLGILLPNFSRHTMSHRGDQDVHAKDEVEVSAMERAIADISASTDHLHHFVESLASQNSLSSPHSTLQSQFDEVVTLSAHVRSVAKELSSIHDSFLNVDRMLQQLSTRCGDNAHFASATRLEWSTMGSKLRQLREHHDKIKSISEKANKNQAITSENLSKSLEFNKIYSNHSENVRGHLSDLYEKTRAGFHLLDQMSTSIGGSKVDVNKASELVKGLSERAEAIVNIIDVIDDIAEQTNQLALNASIEAARAGEQGQGFAVVAGEVRNLAARSSTATKSITDLLGTIQEEAEHASQLLEKSNATVSESYKKIHEVDQSYRESLILARHSVTGLDVLLNDVNSHFAEIKQIEKLNIDVKKMCHNLNSMLEEHGDMSSQINTEGNQLTIHVDRLSRLLSRQYYEVNHSQKLLSLNVASVSAIKSKVEQSLANTETMKHNLDEMYKTSTKFEQRNINHNIAAFKNIQVLRSSARTLHLVRSPLSVYPPTAAAQDGKEGSEVTPTHSSESQSKKSSAPLNSNQSALSTISKLPQEDILIGSNEGDNQAG